MMKNKPTVYILVGVPASGKSTWVKSFKAIGFKPKTVIISTDNFIETIAVTLNKTYSEIFDEYIKEATSCMMSELNIAKEYHLNIIWDQTNVSVKSRKNKLRLLNGYHKVAVIFKTPSNDELKRRLDSRHGKHIPMAVMNSMISNFKEPTLEEGFDEVIYSTDF